MMDLVERIAEESLNIRLPFRKYDRGKAHSYELVFREAIEAMRKAFIAIPELKTAALTGEKPSAESVAELKKLGQVQETISDGVPVWTFKTIPEPIRRNAPSNLEAVQQAMAGQHQEPLGHPCAGQGPASRFDRTTPTEQLRELRGSVADVP